MSPILGRPIIIDCSHGLNNTKKGLFDPGAVNPRLGFREADLVLSLGTMLEVYLRDRLRLPTYRIFDQPYSARPMLANNHNGICFVSLEFNAAGGHGTEALHYPLSVEGIRLSRILVEEITRTTGWRNRGVLARTLGELKNTAMPASTLEVCFIDNDAEIQTYLEKQHSIMLAISVGIMRYLAGSRA